ncbi:BglG family transcription antiterminator [Aureibacillus halotolerans]|uniref:BglG family transcriptional antiterminator n=1 Tax=Aureibacillus halotolerans TaxID=1508390 RepID=A0A4V3D4W8_9BACI|nr:BglG family transcription antiterminator [Aureibacillus halotolerans]TDQ37747.1 BglG family transcriptional antiterminator [Aureibacillus halotolerans]
MSLGVFGKKRRREGWPLYLSGRERRILDLLLNAREELTVKELASELDVSVRTIHRDFPQLNDVLKKHQLTLQKRSGAGLQIHGDEQAKQALANTLQLATKTDFLPEERQAMLMAALLQASEPVKLFSLADDMHVTMATISHDLDKIQTTLESHALLLVRKRGYGVKIEGEEGAKRAALSQLISSNVDAYDVFTTFKEKLSSSPSLSLVSQRLLGLVGEDTLWKIDAHVRKMSDGLPYELADMSRIGLVIHLALAIERLKQGGRIQFDPLELTQLKGTREFRVAKAMIAGLETVFSIPIPEDEIGYITMHLLGAKLKANEPDVLSNLAYQAKEFLRLVGEAIGEQLTDRHRLLNDLMTHLKPTIYRLRQGMQIQNPLLEDIRTTYPELFDITAECAREVFPEVSFPDDEVGFLLLHIAADVLKRQAKRTLHTLVICSSGIGTAKLLATRLQQEVPEITQIDNRSLFDLDKLNLDQYDLIVSTVPLKGMSHDYILASPILSKADIHNIKKAVIRVSLVHKEGEMLKSFGPTEEHSTEAIVQQLTTMHQYSTAALMIIKGFRIQQLTKQDTLASQLAFICQQLEEDDTLRDSPGVVEKLLHRQRLGGLGIPKTSLALFHTRSPSVLQPSFTMYRLSHAIDVPGMDQVDMKASTILMLLAPEQLDQETLTLLSTISSLLIQDEESTTLFEEGNEQELRQRIAAELFQKRPTKGV